VRRNSPTWPVEMRRLVELGFCRERAVGGRFSSELWRYRILWLLLCGQQSGCAFRAGAAAGKLRDAGGRPAHLVSRVRRSWSKLAKVCALLGAGPAIVSAVWLCEATAAVLLFLWAYSQMQPVRCYNKLLDVVGNTGLLLHIPEKRDDDGVLSCIAILREKDGFCTSIGSGA